MSRLLALVESGILDPLVDISADEVNGDGQWRSERRCVYLVRCGKAYKIGYAKDVASRICGINTSSPSPATLVYAVETPRFRELEKALHLRFQARRIQREWFALTRKDLATARLVMFAESWSEEDLTELP